ncbi:hypothetical protein [Clostridium perfringens]|uniref:hypothetical protein n=1 Tax=Clostridium perfringens TaxID=1502 RepID=UPI001A1EE75F|nr:hypothetical protein [Clostridium perfringens]MDU1966894.1 hypothetical protein [Clostridium perfringens]MDU3018081.1 hypothetical protein [Clostridium perfringens]WEV19427.1 hypothetical protein PL323_02060 [Clostridium perfringens D]HAT4354549.1 hypothetical protein [Clostridium perfringens]
MNLNIIENFLNQSVEFLIELGPSILEKARTSEFSEREIIRIIDDFSVIVISMKKTNVNIEKIEKLENLIEELKNI